MSMMFVGDRQLTQRYKTADEIQPLIDGYFKKCDETVISEVFDRNGNVLKRITEPYTVGGLALALGTDRETLSEWIRKENDAVSDAIARAKLRCSVRQEVNSLIGAYNPQFAIFSFKNNFGWRDKTEIEHSGELSIDRIIDNVSTKPIDGQLVDDSSIDFLEENNPENEQ